MNEIKKISIWGVTGSIGQQTLDVIQPYQDRFQVVAMTAHRNVESLYEAAERFHPKYVCLTSGDLDEEWKRKFKALGVQTFQEKSGLLEVAQCGEEDLIVNALVGSVGLEATLLAIQKNISIALANKEVLVMAGELVTNEIQKRSLHLLPIDSEHSAIFQCLQGEAVSGIHRLLLTASGGPFRNRDKSTFDDISPEEALAHPNWSMGKKVTIDSATLMNKGLEVIEARWLFGLPLEKVDVCIHPQSIVHSMVEFVDGSVKAQVGAPDMRMPISYALTWPERWPGHYRRLDLSQPSTWELHPPDLEKFPCLNMAYEALKLGGTAPAVLNAADEMAVPLFLEGKIPFTAISEIIYRSLENIEVIQTPNLETILDFDRKTKMYVQETLYPQLMRKI